MIEPVHTYKAISNQLLFFGFQIMDLAALVVLFLFVHAIGNSFLVDVIVFVPAVFWARKIGRRSESWTLSFIVYCVIPRFMKVDREEDVPAYRKVWSESR